jgi:formylglycine-generating enzyme required for sulfatase activity
MLDPCNWRVLTNLVVMSSPYVILDWGASPERRFYQAASGPERPGLWNADRWAWISPGTFVMGSPDGEQDRNSNEGPQTQVTLTKGFWIGKYEVTQGEYLAVMGTKPSSFQGDLNLPVEMVSWHDATNYCGQLTARERGLGRLPAGWEYRLPTEAQWEYACRAGATTRFGYGDDASYSQLAQYGWYAANSGNQTHAVGQKLPNGWRLHDMHGNVSEWCWDWYAGSLPGGSIADPGGPTAGSNRVRRGGAWDYGGRVLRSASRPVGLGPSNRGSDLGFRVVLVQVP